MIANSGRKKMKKPKNPKKKSSQKNDCISTKKTEKKIKNQKKIVSASFTFLSPLRGEAD